MRRRLNVRFLLALLAVCGLAGAGLTALYRHQAARLLDTLRHQAEQAEEAGEFDRATASYRRYLQLQPGDEDAQERFGLLLARRAVTPQEREAALRVLDGATTKRLPSREARRRLALLALDLGRPALARRQLELLLIAHPADGEYEFLMGRCEAAQGRGEEAVDWFGKAVGHAPRQVEAYLQLAGLLQRLDQPQRVGEVLNALVAANPNEVRGYLARAQHHQRGGALDAAAADVARAAALSPGVGDVLAAEAEVALARGEHALAADRARRYLGVGPPRSEVFLLLAVAEERAGRPAEALACVRQGQKAVPAGKGRAALACKEAELLLRAGRSDEARAALARARQGQAATAQVDLLEARLLNQDGSWGEVAEAVSRALPGLTGADTLLANQLARVAAGPDDYRQHLVLGCNLWAAAGPNQEAETVLRRAYARGGHAADAAITLAQYLENAGQKDRAEAVLAEVRSSWPRDRALAVLPYLNELLGHPDLAEAEHAAALALPEPPASLLRAAADFHLRRNDFARAEPTLRRLLLPAARASAADLAWARRKLAIGLALGGDHRRFRDALALLKENPNTGSEDRVADERARAVVLAQAAPHRADAIRLLEALSERVALTPAERFLLVQLHEAADAWPRARLHLFALLGAPHGKTPDTLAHAIRGLLRHGEAAQVQPLLAELKRLEPESLRAALLEAATLKAAGDPAAALALVQKAAARPGADLGVLAAAAEELGQADAADELYRRHEAAGPQPNALLARARFLARRRQTAEALALCDRALERYPGAPVAQTYTALLRAGRATPAQCRQAERQLRAALQQSPDELPLLLACADFYDALGQYPQAITLYRAALKRQPDHPAALNNLAWLLGWQREHAAEALKLVNRALELRGPVAPLLDTRGGIYLALDNTRAALSDLEAALAQEPTAVRHAHLARAHWSNGRAREASAALDRARAASLDPDALHPLDRAAYLELARRLTRK
jgi:tetratricopeptide (TPR) repeat protein